MSLKTTYMSTIKCYAEGLFLAAVEDKKDLKKLQQNVTKLTEIMNIKDFHKLLFMKHISKEIFSQIITEICQKNDIEDIISRFLNILHQNNRVFLAKHIFEMFLAIIARNSNEMFADIVVAKPLKETFKANITSILSESFNQKVHINEIVNENILGGFIIKTDSRIFDASISSQLQNLKKKLTYI